MNLKRLFQGRFASFSSALLFAVIGTSTLALGVGLILRVLQRDNAAFLQQSIGDTSSMLALQVRLEVERLERVLKEIGDEKLRPQISQQENEVTVISSGGASSPVNAALAEAASVIAAANTTGMIESEPEISEVSLWKRPDPHQPATRAYLAVNSRFSDNFAGRMARIQETEEANRARIEPAFHGHAVVVSDPFSGLSKPIVLVAFPLGNGEVNEVVSAHVSFEKVQKLFSMDGLVQSALVDHDGVTLAHADPSRIAHRESEPGRPMAALFEHLGDAGRSIETGIQTMSDPSGNVFYGGFRKISSVGVSVLSSVSADQAGASLDGIRKQLLAYLAFVFAALFLGRTLFLRRRAPAPATVDPPKEATGLKIEAYPMRPRKVAVMALHGSMRGFNQLLENAGAEEATEALNDYFLTAAQLVRASGGHFECYTGASFGATWELKDNAPGAAQSRAVACALQLRADLARLNESRKLDGKKPLKQGLGLHVGQALVARLGAIPDLRESVTGEVLACARALDRLALAESRDFVASQEAIRSARGTFSGKALGEARLTADTGLTSYYLIVGYAEDLKLTEGVIEPGTFAGQEHGDPGASGADERLTGGESRVAIVRPEAAPSRWLVNNGSQIVGPFTTLQLSKMLFAQELDFDCECWHEETGRSSRLENAGIFSGSQDADASYWVYDGELLHGPISEGFIRTALQHGAFKEDAMVCEKSTISGWKKLGALIAELAQGAELSSTARKPDKDSGSSAA